MKKILLNLSKKITHNQYKKFCMLSIFILPILIYFSTFISLYLSIVLSLIFIEIIITYTITKSIHIELQIWFFIWQEFLSQQQTIKFKNFTIYEEHQLYQKIKNKTYNFDDLLKSI